MGIVKLGMSTVILSLSLAGIANASEYSAADNSKESKLCVAAATNNKMQMHRKVADFTPTIMTSKNYRLVANNLYCNGVNISDFAKSAGNFVVADKLASYRENFVEIKDLAKRRNGTVHIGSK